MLHGEQVTLRPLRDDDFEDWYAGVADVGLSLLASDRSTPVTIDMARERWSNMLHASPEVRVCFAIDVADTYVGLVTINDINRHSQHAMLSIGLRDRSLLGKGYGRDALRTVLRWAFRVHHLHRIELATWATNERAIRAYRAAGFEEEGRLRDGVWLDGRYVDVVVMGAIAPDWLARYDMPPMEY